MDDIINYNKKAYKVVQSFIFQLDWVPSDILALYIPVNNVEVENETSDEVKVIKVFFKPNEHHDAYQTGEKYNLVEKSINQWSIITCIARMIILNVGNW